MALDLKRQLLQQNGANEDTDVDETQEWLEALEDVIRIKGYDRTVFLLNKLVQKGHSKGVKLPFTGTTPYVNTIHHSEQPKFPGNRAIERRMKSIIRWNAMAMVVRANMKSPGIGGHISTYASAATLYEVGFNHFFRGRGDGFDGDQIFFQGHAAPGIYARAFVEGRLNQKTLENFRRELEQGGGLSSYPHPWLMRDFWEFPTVSMGLGPINAIYQARFNRYLHDRGIKDTKNSHVWAFLGDGETDEPETLGAIALASREKLDNLIFVVNCNLQRLDGPVRGNGKIIQELETVFRGAGWNAIKVIWGNDWDPIFDNDSTGKLVQDMNETVDGQFQKYSVESGEYIRKNVFGKHPEIMKLIEHLSDREVKKLRRGGHDPEKVYTAYKAAVESEGKPTVILAKTIKGYGLGEAGEGKNITHNQKKLNEEELKYFRDHFDIPVPDSKIHTAPFYKPDPKSEEMEYFLERRRVLGGFVPSRKVYNIPLDVPKRDTFKNFFTGTDREVSTTMVFVRMLSDLLKNPDIGKRIVPIVPDEARTFGMESLFRQCGIYSHIGQLYEPVDANTFLYYKESIDGQILEEGINEAGSLASFTAAGTSYATHGEVMIPFFIFYSMFGFQRVGDLIWAFGDLRGRGFLLGATSGRTSLNGEGLQHEDGHSHVLASTIPNLLTFDPTFAYEIAIILQDGIKRMYENMEDIFYYITLGNENYPMAEMPKGVEEGILKGLYKFRAAPKSKAKNSLKAHILGSGSILNEALRAQNILLEKYKVHADIWSATSYKELRREALETERWNLLHPTQKTKKSYVQELFENEEGPIVAASDYMKIVPEQIGRWLPGRLYSLGTDGFGRSDTRESLRRFFEVDAEFIAVTVLYQLAQQGKVKLEVVEKAIKDFKIDPEKINPITA